MNRVPPIATGFGLLVLAVAVFALVVAAPYISGRRANVDAVRQGERGIWNTVRSYDIEQLNLEIDRLTAGIENPPRPSRIRIHELRKAGRTDEQIDETMQKEQEAQTAALRTERAGLIARRDEIKAEMGKPAPSKSFSEVLDDLSLFLSAVPFAVLGVYVMRAAFAAELPNRNPLGLDDRSRRGTIFVTACLLFAIAIVALGAGLLYLL